MTEAFMFGDLPRGWPHHIVKISELLYEFRPKNCVEIGTYCGASAIAIARAIKNWNGHLTCVDSWEGCFRPTLQECVDNLQARGVAGSVSLVPTSSADAALHWTCGPIDFLYIDADHRYNAVLSDLRMWWPHVRIGGIVCGDDYDDPMSPGVAEAWNDFGREVDHVFLTFATPNTDPPGMKLVWGVKAR